MIGAKRRAASFEIPTVCGAPLGQLPSARVRQKIKLKLSRARLANEHFVCVRIGAPEVDGGSAKNEKAGPPSCARAARLTGAEAPLESRPPPENPQMPMGGLPNKYHRIADDSVQGRALEGNVSSETSTNPCVECLLGSWYQEAASEAQSSQRKGSRAGQTKPG